MTAIPQQVNKRLIWLAVALLLAGSVLCLATFGRETLQQSRRISLQKQLEQLPKISQSEIDDIAARIRPLVVEIAGADFVSPPLIRIANRDQLGDFLNADLSAISKHRGFNEADLTAGFASAMQIMQVQTSILGKYSPSAKTVLIVPENFPHILAAFEVSPDRLKEIVTLIVAHELVHALQDQHKPIHDLMAACPTLEAGRALAAALEGHSMTVEHEIAKRLGSEHASQVLEKIVISTPSGIGCQPSEGLSDRQKIYEHGRVAMGNKYRIGGATEMWRVFDNLPASMLELQGDASNRP